VIALENLPAVNASLNALAACWLVTGWFLIRARRVRAHAFSMIAAFVTSGLFLASYLYYHAHHGSTPFRGTGTARLVYFTLLISHSILAIAVVPLAILSLILGLRGLFPRHRAVARWALPIWLYVSVTGVVVYWMLYRLYA